MNPLFQALHEPTFTTRSAPKEPLLGADLARVRASLNCSFTHTVVAVKRHDLVIQQIEQFEATFEIWPFTIFRDLSKSANPLDDHIHDHHNLIACSTDLVPRI